MIFVFLQILTLAIVVTAKAVPLQDQVKNVLEIEQMLNQADPSENDILDKLDLTQHETTTSQDNYEITTQNAVEQESTTIQAEQKPITESIVNVTSSTTTTEKNLQMVDETKINEDIGFEMQEPIMSNLPVEQMEEVKNFEIVFPENQDNTDDTLVGEIYSEDHIPNFEFNDPNNEEIDVIDDEESYSADEVIPVPEIPIAVEVEIQEPEIIPISEDQSEIDVEPLAAEADIHPDMFYNDDEIVSIVEEPEIVIPDTEDDTLIPELSIIEISDETEIPDAVDETIDEQNEMVVPGKLNVMLLEKEEIEPQEIGDEDELVLDLTFDEIPESEIESDTDELIKPEPGDETDITISIKLDEQQDVPQIVQTDVMDETELPFQETIDMIDDFEIKPNEPEMIDETNFFQPINPISILELLMRSQQAIMKKPEEFDIFPPSDDPTFPMPIPVIRDDNMESEQPLPMFVPNNQDTPIPAENNFNFQPMEMMPFGQFDKTNMNRFNMDMNMNDMNMGMNMNDMNMGMNMNDMNMGMNMDMDMNMNMNGMDMNMNNMDPMEMSVFNSNNQDKIQGEILYQNPNENQLVSQQLVPPVRSNPLVIIFESNTNEDSVFQPEMTPEQPLEQKEITFPNDMPFQMNPPMLPMEDFVNDEMIFNDNSGYEDIYSAIPSLINSVPNSEPNIIPETEPIMENNANDLVLLDQELSEPLESTDVESSFPEINEIIDPTEEPLVEIEDGNDEETQDILETPMSQAIENLKITVSENPSFDRTYLPPYESAASRLFSEILYELTNRRSSFPSQEFNGPYDQSYSNYGLIEPFSRRNTYSPYSYDNYYKDYDFINDGTDFTNINYPYYSRNDYFPSPSDRLFNYVNGINRRPLRRNRIHLNPYAFKYLF